MSLIIQTLNRLKGRGKNKPVPPGLKGEVRKEEGGKRFFIYAGVIIILAGALSILLINRDKLLYGDRDNILSRVENTLKIARNTASTSDGRPVKNIEKENPKKTSESINPIAPEEKYTVKKEPVPPETKKTVAAKKNRQEKKAENKNRKNIYLYNSYISLANSYLEKGDYRESLLYYKKAYSLEKNQKVLKNIIVLQILTGNFEDLYRYIPQLKEESYIADIAISLIDSGHLNRAEEFLSRFIGMSSPYILYAWGILLEKQGKYQQALVYYRKAYQLNPYDQYIAYAYGRILEINGFYKKAVNIYTGMLNLEGLDKRIKEILQERIKILR
ncbi:tetratricopeptide repeat protein [Persephonella sp.]